MDISSVSTSPYDVLLTSLPLKSTSLPVTSTKSPSSRESDFVTIVDSSFSHTSSSSSSIVTNMKIEMCQPHVYHIDIKANEKLAVFSPGFQSSSKYPVNLHCSVSIATTKRSVNISCFLFNTLVLKCCLLYN